MRNVTVYAIECDSFVKCLQKRRKTVIPKRAIQLISVHQICTTHPNCTILRIKSKRSITWSVCMCIRNARLFVYPLSHISHIVRHPPRHVFNFSIVWTFAFSVRCCIDCDIIILYRIPRHKERNEELHKVNYTLRIRAYFIVWTSFGRCCSFVYTLRCPLTASDDVRLHNSAVYCG